MTAQRRARTLSRAGSATSRRARPPSGRRSGRQWLVAIAAAGAVLLLLVIAAARSGRPGGQAVSVSGAAATTVGSVAPAFSAPTLTGALFRSPRQRPTVLYFMAGWCGSCIPEAEALGRAQRSVGDRATLVAVDADPTDPWSSLALFSHQVGSPTYLFAKDDGRIARAFGVTSLDTSIALDRNGRVIARTIGALDDTGLRQLLAKAGITT